MVSGSKIHFDSNEHCCPLASHRTLRGRSRTSEGQRVVYLRKSAFICGWCCLLFASVRELIRVDSRSLSFSATNGVRRRGNASL